MDALTDDERHLLQTVQVMARLTSGHATGWRYGHVSALLLDLGRLFTPTAPPAELGAERQCWSNATFYAEDHDAAVYVEGWAVHPGLAALGMETPHAWCATGTKAIDPSPGWDGGAYLGVPLTDDYRRHLQRRHGIGPLFFADTVVDADLLRLGLPADAVADVGRPLPDLAASKSGADQA